MSETLEEQIAAAPLQPLGSLAGRTRCDDLQGRGRQALTLEYADGRAPDLVQLPDDGFWQPVTWESATQLVLYVPGDQPDPLAPAEVAELTRCDVVARTCTQIDDVPQGPVDWPVDAGY